MISIANFSFSLWRYLKWGAKCGEIFRSVESQSMFPAQQAEIPTKKSTIPAQQAEIPIKKSTFPAQQAEIPAKQSMFPAQQAEIPTKRMISFCRGRIRNFKAGHDSLLWDIRRFRRTGTGCGHEDFRGPGECSRSLAVAGTYCDQKSIRLYQWCTFIFNQRMDAHMGPVLEIPCNKECFNGGVIFNCQPLQHVIDTCLFSGANYSIFFFVLVGVITWRSFGELLCRDLDLKLGHHRSPLHTVRIQIWKFGKFSENFEKSLKNFWKIFVKILKNFCKNLSVQARFSPRLYKLIILAECSRINTFYVAASVDWSIVSRFKATKTFEITADFRRLLWSGHYACTKSMSPELQMSPRSSEPCLELYCGAAITPVQKAWAQGYRCPLDLLSHV